MKRLSIACLLALAVFGCRSKETVTSTDTVSTSGTETTGTTSTTSTGSSGGTTSSLNAEDKGFFMAAAQASMAELSLGEMAADKATSKDVLNFASRMVADHSKANDDLKQLAIKKGVALPAVQTKEQNKTSTDLSQKVGTAFDKSYMEEMIRDHEKAVNDFEKGSKEATDPDLKAWAMKMLSTLQDHLRIAKQIASKLR
jgi:putative membrane protein